MVRNKNLSISNSSKYYEKIPLCVADVCSNNNVLG